MAPWGDQTQLSSGVLGTLRYLPRDDPVLPFDPGEIDPPLVAVLGWRGAMSKLGQHLPGDRELDRPGLIGVLEVIERALRHGRPSSSQGSPTR